MNVFVRDNEWQKGLRDRILAPGFYGSYALGGRYVFIDKGALATKFQREYAVDTILQGKGGAAVCIEEKIVRWPKKDKPYSAFTLETRSCTVPGREKDGWMKYGEADYLLYCFANRTESALHCYLIDFPKLKEWFWPIVENWPITVTEQINRTECRVVPITEVEANVRCWSRLVATDDTYDANKDLAGSLDHGYQAVRDRMANGGAGWSPEMSRWFRHYAGTMRDPKFVGIAVRCEQPVERVLFVWGCILESAAELNDAGRYDVEPNELAYFLRCEGTAIDAITDELETRGMIGAGVVTQWKKRQYESDTSTERSRKHRETKRNADATLQERCATPPETETETEEDTEAKTEPLSPILAKQPKKDFS